MMKRASALAIILLATATVHAQKLPQSEEEMNKLELKKIAQLEKDLVAARKKFFANSKDAKAKKAYIAAAEKLADTVYITPAYNSKQKYPKALKLYREIVIVDPKNKKAQERVSLIESIYKSMGRKVPT